MGKLRVIISGGGTGGHIFPALAIARSLQKKADSIDLLFVGAKDRMEMQKIPAAGYKIEGLWISGFQRKINIRNLLFPFKVIASVFKSIKIINRFNPDLVIGTGGFASGPLLYVAAKKGIPTIIQEQNSYAGITNRILAKYVNRICVAYSDMDRFFPKEKICFSGNPIRKDILSFSKKRDEAISYFDLDNTYFTILVIGGSLGALSINTAIKQSLEKFANKKINLIWQTGVSFQKEAEDVLKELNLPNVNHHAFINRMDLAYSAADIIVSRAGAIAISELCCIGKPLILIPSPNVAENHQYKNAQSLVNKNAAILVEDAEVNCKLVSELMNLMRDKDKQLELSCNIKKLAVTDAAEKIADLGLQILEE